MPFALAALSVAASGAATLMTDASHEVHVVAADAVGLLYGGIGTGVIASVLTDHVDVQVTFS
jgi:hypothetical protein